MDEISALEDEKAFSRCFTENEINRGTLHTCRKNAEFLSEFTETCKCIMKKENGEAPVTDAKKRLRKQYEHSKESYTSLVRMVDKQVQFLFDSNDEQLRVQFKGNYSKANDYVRGNDYDTFIRNANSKLPTKLAKMSRAKKNLRVISTLHSLLCGENEIKAKTLIDTWFEELHAYLGYLQLVMDNLLNVNVSIPSLTRDPLLERISKKLNLNPMFAMYHDEMAKIAYMRSELESDLGVHYWSFSESGSGSDDDGDDGDDDVDDDDVSCCNDSKSFDSSDPDNFIWH